MKTCPVCGAEFLPRCKHQKYCRRRCYNRARVSRRRNLRLKDFPACPLSYAMHSSETSICPFLYLSQQIQAKAANLENLAISQAGN